MQGMLSNERISNSSIFGSLGSNTKSVQTGNATLSNGIASLAVAIASVDLTKAIVFVNFYPIVTGSADSKFVRAEITSSTTVTLSRAATVGNMSISWIVVEFNNVKSLQKGTTTLSATTLNVTVNAIGSKFLLVQSFQYTYGVSDVSYSMLQAYLSSSTQITFKQVYELATKSIHWQLIEFE